MANGYGYGVEECASPSPCAFAIQERNMKGLTDSFVTVCNAARWWLRRAPATLHQFIIRQGKNGALNGMASLTVLAKQSYYSVEWSGVKWERKEIVSKSWSAGAVVQSQSQCSSPSPLAMVLLRRRLFSLHWTLHLIVVTKQEPHCLFPYLKVFSLLLFLRRFRWNEKPKEQIMGI